MITSDVRLCLITALASLALAAGCAKGIDPNYAAYLKTAANKEQKPLVEIKAVPGQQITGLASITVYAPGQSVARLEQYKPPPPHPVWGVLGSAIRAASVVGSIWAAGDAAKGLANAVGKHAGHNTTISGTASGTQSGVVVPTGAGSSGSQAPADSHDSSITGAEE